MDFLTDNEIKEIAKELMDEEKLQAINNGENIPIDWNISYFENIVIKKHYQAMRKMQNQLIRLI